MLRRYTATLVEMAGASLVLGCSYLLSPWLLGVYAGAALVYGAQLLPATAPNEEAPQ